VVRKPIDEAWFAPGRTLCVAVDVDAGAMHLATDGGAWAHAFDGVRPAADAGAGVYPVVCGGGGVRARCHLGREPGREMRVAPPSGEYRWIWEGREQVGTGTARGGGSAGRRGGPAREGRQAAASVRLAREGEERP
jgi:hypothetical protein